MPSRFTIDVWGRYRVIYLDDEDEWSSRLRDLVTAQIAQDKWRSIHDRLVTRYVFEVTQEPKMTVRLVAEKFRPYIDPMWGTHSDYATFPLEFSSTRSYLHQLGKIAAADNKKRLTDTWMAYFVNNNFLMNGNTVYVDQYNANFTVFNQLSMMAGHLPWLESQVHQD